AMSCSHPSTAFILQSPKPALHDTSRHMLLTQPPEALAKMQLTPQLPQLKRWLVTFTSQPFLSFLSQSTKPGLHRSIPPTALLHRGTALAGGAHTWPQAPQLFTWRTSVSQPSFGSLLQSAQPYMQLPTPQTPFKQFGAPLAGRGHTTPQPPQLRTS